MNSLAIAICTTVRTLQFHLPADHATGMCDIVPARPRRIASAEEIGRCNYAPTRGTRASGFATTSLGPGLPPISVRAGIALPVLLRRAVCDAGACFAGDRRCELQLLQEDRPGKIIALRIPDLGRSLEVGELLVGFDAFGDHGHAERFAQGFDRAQDALVARALMDGGDERAADLDPGGGGGG